MVGDLVGGRGSGCGRCWFGSSGDVPWLVLRLACGACGGILTRPCLAVLSVNTTCYECPKLVGCRNSNAQPATPARTGAGMVVVVVVIGRLILPVELTSTCYMHCLALG